MREQVESEDGEDGASSKRGRSGEVGAWTWEPETSEHAVGSEEGNATERGERPGDIKVSAAARGTPSAHSRIEGRA